MITMRELCGACRGRGWVILGGIRQDCPRPGCEAGWIDPGTAPPFDVAELLAPPAAELLGPAVEYWSHLAVARDVIARYRRELPEGASTVPAPDWLMWAVLLNRALGGLVESIAALGGTPPPRPPWVTS